jgi:hypothetical protein
MKRYALGAVLLVLLLGAVPAQSRTSHDPRCTAETDVPLVKAVVAAFNSGNVAKLDRLVAREPAFQWFADAGPRRQSRLGPRAEDRSTLRAWAKARHRKHDRITLVGFGEPNAQGGVRLNLDLRRHADDYRPRNVIHGKYEAVCPPGRARIVVWAM